MSKVFNKKNKDYSEDAVYVGRPSKFGNPFVIGRDGSRTEVIQKFKQTKLSDPVFINQVRTELKGKDLICWCAPLPCHADILLEIANAK